MPYSQQKLELCDGWDARLREALTYYPESGELKWVSGCFVGRRAGNIGATNRRRVRFEGKIYYADELIYRYVRGHWPSGEVVHLNGDKHDDRWKNLATNPAMF